MNIDGSTYIKMTLSPLPCRVKMNSMASALAAVKAPSFMRVHRLEKQRLTPMRESHTTLYVNMEQTGYD